MSTLDFIINVFILLILFAFLMDLFVIAYRQYQVTHLTNDVIWLYQNKVELQEIRHIIFPVE